MKKIKKIVEISYQTESKLRGINPKILIKRQAQLPATIATFSLKIYQKKIV
ncbi:MAG: hypothetical protein AABX16_02670 [Nanoarchaeota archaeon]